MNSAIIEHLKMVMDHEPWYGPATFDLLKDVTGTEARAYPVSGFHSIWEIVLHMMTWQNEGKRILKGGKRATLPDEQDWPTVPPDASDLKWQETKSALRSSLEELIEAIRNNEEHEFLKFGILEHNVYHTGQIALLRKMIKR